MPPSLPSTTGPKADHFCGGVGGQELNGGPYQQLELRCAEPGATIAAIDWASWGSYGCQEGPSRNCHYPTELLLKQWVEGSCTPQRFATVANASAVPCPHTNHSQVMGIVTHGCVGKQMCQVELSAVTFPADPCFGIYKSLFVAAHCSSGEGSVTTLTPTTPSPQHHGVTIPAQQSFVLEIPAAMIATRRSNGDSEQPMYIWGGDRWQSAPDHYKSHDFMVWVPFHFSEDGTSVQALNYNLSWPLPLRETDSSTGALKSDDVDSVFPAAAGERPESRTKPLFSVHVPLYDPQLGPNSAEIAPLLWAAQRVVISVTICGMFIGCEAIGQCCHTEKNEQAAAILRAANITVLHYVPTMQPLRQ